MQNNSHEFDLCYLVGCGLRQEPPDPRRVECMDLEAIYAESTAASLSALTCMALESCREPCHLPPQWVEDKNKVLRKTMLMDLERRAVCQAMEEQGCWYLPLKGSILKDLYPRMGMRQMADTDILFDRRFRSWVCSWFEDRGYRTVSQGETNHDVYEKPPVLNFEMHVDLFSSYYNEKWPDYFTSLEDRLLPLEGTAYGRAMTDEDFYLYFLAHGYKHYADGGTGLRTLCDFWVWLRKKEAVLDWDALYPILDSLGLRRYEQELRQLAHSVFDGDFDPDSLEDHQREILRYLLGCGTYGSWENEVTNAWKAARQTEESRIRYLWRRLFPGRDFYAQQIDREALLKSPWKRFCFNSRRLLRALVSRKSQICRELRIIFKRE